MSVLRDDFYWTLHAVFVKRHEHTILFDQAFRIFFRKRGYIEKLIASMMPQTLEPAAKSPPPGAQRIQEALFSGLNERAKDQSEIEIDARLTVSDREVLQKKDFAQMTAAEIAAAKDAIARLTLPLDEVRTRRLTQNRRGHLIDIRRTLRASMKAGGAVIDLKYLGPRREGAADCRVARYLGLDERIHAAVSALPARRYRRPQTRHHLSLRHAVDQCHPRDPSARSG